MKTAVLRLPLFVFLFFMVCAFIDGSPDELNKGIGILAIDKKLSEIKSQLVKADTGKLISNEKNMFGRFVSSVWTVDLKKAKLTDYFGLKIKSVEVYCSTEDATGEVAAEHIRSFVIYTEKTGTPAALDEFRSKTRGKYGEPQSRMFSPDFTECVYDSWYNDSDRMLDLIYGIDIATGDSLNYFEASYR